MTIENKIGSVIRRVATIGIASAIIGSGAYAKDIQLPITTVWHTSENQTDECIGGVLGNAINLELLKTIETRKPPVMKPDIVTLGSGATVAFSEEKTENKDVITKIEKRLKDNDFAYIDDGKVFVSNYELREDSKITYDSKGICVVSGDGEITDRFSLKTKSFEKLLKVEFIESSEPEISIRKSKLSIN